MLTVFLAASSGIVATYRPAASEHTPYDSCVPLFFVASMWAWISAYLSLTLCCCEDDGDPFSGRRTLDSNRVRLTTFMCIQIVIVMVSAFGTSCGGDLKGDAEQISLVTSEIGLLLCATDCIWKLGACVDDDGDGF